MLTEVERTKLLKEVEPLIIKKVREFYRPYYDMDDLMQEAFTAVDIALNKFNPEKAKLTTYVYIVVVNHLRTYLKKYNEIGTTEFTDKEEIIMMQSQPQNYYYNEYYLKLEELFKDNSNYFTEVESLFILDLIERKSFEEIEQHLGITSNFRRQLTMKIKNKLIRIIKGER